ncbi:hypothetical protein BN1708_014268, partial [Verticillium longisporum]
MADHFPTITQCAIVAAAFKVLLFPAYKSTDFEVHRNWLAITESLPISQWYLEKTSEWTLDYPPFFAYFEWALSQVAKLVDPSMTKLYNLEYDSWQTIYFQRWSVIISEIVLVFALHMFIDSASPSNRRATQTAALSILLSPGLLIIDHIHFQYNGCMYGILIISLVLARSKSTLLSSGLVFAALLCMKHIYLYLAPAYFVFLLRAYCLSPRSIYNIRFFNCVKLGVGITAIFGAAFEEEEEARSPTPEAERPPARATRSSLAKAEAERLAAELKAAEAEAAEPEVKHRAEDLLEEYEWIEHLRKRDFKDGGWEMIMVGLWQPQSGGRQHPTERWTGR